MLSNLVPFCSVDMLQEYPNTLDSPPLARLNELDDADDGGLLSALPPADTGLVRGLPARPEPPAAAAASAAGLDVAAKTAAALPPRSEQPPGSPVVPGHGVEALAAEVDEDVSEAAVSVTGVSDGPDWEADRLPGVGGRAECVGRLTAGGGGAWRSESCRVRSGPFVKKVCVCDCCACCCCC